MAASVASGGRQLLKVSAAEMERDAGERRRREERGGGGEAEEERGGEGKERRRKEQRMLGEMKVW